MPTTTAPAPGTPTATEDGFARRGGQEAAIDAAAAETVVQDVLRGIRVHKMVKRAHDLLFHFPAEKI